MRARLRALLALFTGMALLLLGNGLLNSLIPLAAEAKQLGADRIGWLSSAYFVGFLLGIWLVVPVMRRVGHIRTFALAAASAASVILGHVLVDNFLVWLVLRVLYGAALVSVYAIIESWLNATVQQDHRSSVFSLYMVISLGAVALAQPMLTFASPVAFTLYAICALLICLAMIPVSLTRLAQPEMLSTPDLQPKLIFARAPVAALVCFASGLVLGGFYGLMPIYGSGLNLDTTAIAGVMSFTILGGILGQFPVGLLSEHYDRRRLMLVLALCAVPVGPLLLLITTPLLLYSLLFYWGAIVFALYPLAIAHMVDRLDNSEVISGSTTLLLIYGLGAALGPLLAGQFMHWLSSQWLPFFFSLILLLAVLLIQMSLRAKPKEQLPSSQFAPMMRTTPQSMELMPNISNDDYQQLQDELESQAQMDPESAAHPS